MPKIISENEDIKNRRSRIVIKDVGQVARTSVKDGKFTFGYFDGTTRHMDFSVRELSGYDEDLLESKKNFAEIMKEVCCNVITKIGTIEDKKEIKKIATSKLSHIDRIKVMYYVRQITLGNLFQYKAICYNQKTNPDNKFGFCMNIDKRVGDLSEVVFSRTKEGEIQDFVSKEIKGVKYVIGRITAEKEELVKPLVAGGDTRTARIATHLYQIGDKEISNIDQVRELSTRIRIELDKMIQEDLDEGHVDDIFVHKCTECDQQIEREIELDRDFFFPVEYSV